MFTELGILLDSKSFLWSPASGTFYKTESYILVSWVVWQVLLARIMKHLYDHQLAIIFSFFCISTLKPWFSFETTKAKYPILFCKKLFYEKNCRADGI